MAISDEQIKRIQDEIMATIDSENDLEALIQDTSRQVSAALSLGNKTSFNFQDKSYFVVAQMITLPKGQKAIRLVIANKLNYKISAGNYRPYTATVEYDKDYTYQENLLAAVKGFLSHITGRTRAEALN